jgi:hypothetical protein
VETPDGLVRAPAGLLKRATVDRVLRASGLDHARVTRPVAAVRFQAKRSNEMWHFDRDRRTIGGRSVSALNGVALAVIFGDCIRVQIPASSSFASIWLRAEAENTQDILLLVVLT